MANLADIRTKVRRITRSPSPSQLSDADLDKYINNFLLYDFPEHIRLFIFRKTLSFYTQPNVDQYSTNTIRNVDPLHDFKNAYITSHDPVYIAGYKSYFTQSRNDFYSMYPAIQGSTQIATGDGVTVFFDSTLAGAPVMQNSVLFTSKDANAEGLVLKDIPRIGAATGLPTVIGDLVWPDSTTSVGTINYLTGDYTFTFPAAPVSGEPIYAQTVQYSAARPMSMLYFDNTFTLRPVPDRVYKVEIETYIRPTALADAADIPELEQHWSFISYGTAKRVFEDRMDMDSVQMIMPEFKQQELLCLRRTIVQQSNERVSTIYVGSVDPRINGYGNNYL